MAWRVLCAALWAAEICDNPTVKTIEAPKNRQIRPAPTRVDTEAVVCIVDVVMSPSVRPVKANTLILCGRSPDLRVDGDKAPSQFPSGNNFNTSPLTVAGAVTVSAPFGSSSPYSLLGPMVFQPRAPYAMCLTGERRGRQCFSAVV